MKKRLYSKPFMSVEQFTPSEYVALCWYIAEGDCYTTLYHDTQTTTVWDAQFGIPPVYSHGVYGYFDSGEDVYNGSSHGSHRVPAENAQVKYFKAEALPSPITNDGKYYTGYENVRYNILTGNVNQYTGNVSDNIYMYNAGSTTHYFKNPTQAGNHS